MQETQEMWVRFLSQEDPLKEEMQPTPVFLSGESHGQRSLAGYSPWGCKGVRHDLVTKQQQKNIMSEEKNLERITVVGVSEWMSTCHIVHVLPAWGLAWHLFCSWLSVSCWCQTLLMSDHCLQGWSIFPADWANNLHDFALLLDE